MAKNKKKYDSAPSSAAKSVKIDALVVALSESLPSSDDKTKDSIDLGEKNLNSDTSGKVGEIESGPAILAGTAKRDFVSSPNPLVIERMKLKSGKLLSSSISTAKSSVDKEGCVDSVKATVPLNFSTSETDVVSSAKVIKPVSFLDLNAKENLVVVDNLTEPQGSKDKTLEGEGSVHPPNMMKGVDLAASWVDMAKKNRVLDEKVVKLELNFDGVTEKSVTLDDDDVFDEEEDKHCLIGTFAGVFPGRDFVAKMVNKWTKACKYHFHNSGWVIFEFESEDDAQCVLRQAPYYAGSKPLILKAMPKFFNFNKEACTSVPVWIQMPNLPLRCWKKESLDKICTYLGVPVSTDQITANKATKSFARCLVELDVSKPLPSTVDVILPDKELLVQPILYEDVPAFCMKCKKLGHDDEECDKLKSSTPALYVPAPKVDLSKNRNARRRFNRKNAPAKKPNAVVKGSGDNHVAHETDYADKTGKNSFEVLNSGVVVTWAEESEKEVEDGRISLSVKNVDGDSRGQPPLDLPK